MGCGQLVMQLRRRMSDLEPGERLEVISQSPGAAVDLPAWCRMTGHRLIKAEHPLYTIERRPN